MNKSGKIIASLHSNIYTIWPNKFGVVEIKLPTQTLDLNITKHTWDELDCWPYARTTSSSFPTKSVGKSMQRWLEIPSLQFAMAKKIRLTQKWVVHQTYINVIGQVTTNSCQFSVERSCKSFMSSTHQLFYWNIVLKHQSKREDSKCCHN